MKTQADLQSTPENVFNESKDGSKEVFDLAMNRGWSRSLTKVRTDARRDAAGACLRETEVSGAQLDGPPATVKKPRDFG